MYINSLSLQVKEINPRSTCSIDIGNCFNIFNIYSVNAFKTTILIYNQNSINKNVYIYLISKLSILIALRVKFRGCLLNVETSTKKLCSNGFSGRWLASSGHKVLLTVSESKAPSLKEIISIMMFPDFVCGMSASFSVKVWCSGFFPVPVLWDWGNGTLNQEIWEFFLL